MRLLEGRPVRPPQPRPKHGHDHEDPGTGPGDPASAVWRTSFSLGLARFRGEAPADPAGVHRLRTTTRRLRSTLRLFEGLADPGAASRLAEDLAWLGHALGEVRDLDVLRARFEATTRDLGVADDAGPLFDAIGRRHAAARASLRETLRSERFAGLTDAIATAAEAPPLSADAEAPCRDVMPGLVRPTWSTLKKAARDLSAESPDDAFHRVRKKAKGARYAGEAAAGALGHDGAADAVRFARLARDVQDVLGEHQDAVVAAAVVRQAAAEHPDLGAFNFAAGQILARERAAADASRDAFFPAWARLDRRKAVRWLKP